MLARKLTFSLLALLALGCSDDDSSPSTGSKTRGARLYATVSSTAEVLVIDDATHSVLDSIPVGKGPAIIIQTKDHKKLYTANWADDTVSVIDAQTNKAKQIQMDGRPYVVAMAWDSKYVYVGLDTVNSIAVIDTATDTVARSIKFNTLPASIIAGPDTSKIFVASLGLAITGGSLVGVDVATGDKPWPPVTVGSSPAWITTGPSGKTIYTLNAISDDVSVVDVASWTLRTSIGIGAGSQSIIGNVTPDGTQLWVTNFGSNDVVAIDTTRNEIVKRIPLNAKPVGVEFNTDGSRVYVTDFGPDSVNEPLSVGLTYLTSGVYNGTGNGQVRAFDTKTGAQVGSTVSTGPGATSVLFVPAAE
jgi:YVTN family beta-propeller protein